MIRHDRSTPVGRPRPGARGAPGLLAFAAVAVFILTAGASGLPTGLAQDTPTDACVQATSPEAADPDASPALEALQDIGREIAGSPPASPAAVTPTPCPTEVAPTETPRIEDQLATAAAVAQTATAIALTPEPAPTETPAPEAGEVAAALPPVDLPVTNFQGYSFNLEASLTVDFASVVAEAPVYRLVPFTLSIEQVQALADGFGIGGTVEDRGNGTFVAVGNGQLFVTSSLVQYLSPAQPGAGALPDDGRAIEIARDWLRSSGLVPPDLGEGKVVSRVEEAGRLVVVFTPVEPPNLLAAYPSISVSLGPEGVILEAASRWATIERADLYALRPVEEAWRQVESGEGYVETNLEGAGFADGSVISGLVRYERIDLAYATAGPPGGTQYLAPVYMFSGTLTPEGRTETYPISAYVPAMAVSDNPVGLAPAGPVSIVEGAR